MVVNHQEKTRVQVKGQKISIQMGIANPAWIIQILSEKLYSRPIYTVIQEYLSNGYDANVKAGRMNDPVIMTLRQNEYGQWYVAFTDFGTGMTQESVFKTFAQYGASTKQDSEHEIGMMGLGSKSAFSYVEDDMFFVKSVIDGTQSEYMVKKIGVGTQEIFLTGQSETNLPNGTTVWFFIKDTDVMSFVKAAKDRTPFIPNMVYDFAENLPQLKSKIVDFGEFLYNPLNDQQREAFVVLGKIPYRINWNEVGSQYHLNLPIGIKIELTDGIFPTPNREDLTYDKNAVQTLREKLKQSYAKIIDLINENYLVEDWKEFLKTKNYFYINLNGEQFTINNQMTYTLENISGKKILHKECPKLTMLGVKSNNFNLSNTFGALEIAKYVGKDGKTKKPKSNAVNNYGDFKFLDEGCVYYSFSPSTRFSKEKMLYLKKTYFDKKICFVTLKDFSYADFKSAFSLYDADKSLIADAYQNIINFQLDFFDNLPKFDEIEVPKELKIERKKRSPKKDSNIVVEPQITVYEGNWVYLKRSYDSKFYKETFEATDLLTDNRATIFWADKTNDADWSTAEKIFATFGTVAEKFKFRVFLVPNKKDVIWFQNQPKFKHISEFTKEQFVIDILSANILNEKRISIPQEADYFVEGRKTFLTEIENYIREYKIYYNRFYQDFLFEKEEFKMSQKVQFFLEKYEKIQPLLKVLNYFNWYNNDEEVLKIAKKYIQENQIKFGF